MNIDAQEIKPVIKEIFFNHRHGELYSLEFFQNLLLGLPVARADAIKMAMHVTELQFDTLTVEAFIDWLNSKTNFDIKYTEII